MRCLIFGTLFVASDGFGEMGSPSLYRGTIYRSLPMEFVCFRQLSDASWREIKRQRNNSRIIFDISSMRDLSNNLRDLCIGPIIDVLGDAL